MTAARVNPILCQAFGTCARIAPDLFSQDDWGYAIVTKAELETPSEVEQMAEAIRECPASAIVWMEPPLDVAEE